MNVNVTGAYIYFTIPIFGGIDITQTTVSVFLVTLILGLASYFLGRRLTKRPGKLQVLVEKGVSMMHNMVCDTMGKHNAHWTPYIGTIFLSSICGSFIGLTGFLRSSTADLSVPLVWAVMTTGIIWYQNIKHNGFVGWLKGFTEPVVVMTPMNIVSEIAQPISMAFRHFGNVAGGGVITMILYTALSMASSLVIGLVSGTIVIPIAVAVLGAALIFWGMKVKKNGAKIVKMDCGHHGCNHPIRDLDTGKIEFAPQSHNYMLDAASIEDTGLRITHVNVLDGTPEATESTMYPTLSAQFDLCGDHPLYEKFLKLMEEGKRNA